MPALVIKPRARTDLYNIWRNISNDSPNKADEVLDSIQAQLQMLTEYTHAGRARSALGPFASYPAGDYVIFYRPTKKGIEVVRVLHSSRDISSAF